MAKNFGRGMEVRGVCRVLWRSQGEVMRCL